MGKYSFIKTEIPDLVIIESTMYGDDRGFFMETYTQKDFNDAGITTVFVQDNHSKSAKGVLRGFHFQKEHCQAKLVRTIKGAVFDAVVDLRMGSPSYGKWFGIVLSAQNKRQVYVPEGFAHGFLTLEDDTEFIYKASDYWHPESEGGIIWNDPDIKIEWPLDEYGVNDVVLSEKDKTLPALSEIKSPFNYNK